MIRQEEVAAVDFLRPTSWQQALRARAEHPGALPVAGGTDVMVDVNFDRARPPALLDLSRVPELAEWSESDGSLRIGAGVSYSRLIDEVGDRLPALALASRTVGSPQIRNRGTLGGNLGSASPAGDALPPLLVGDAGIEIASVRGTRMLPVAQFCTGPKRNALAADELIAAVHLAPAAGPQQFSKIGTRNAMVIAVCTFAIALDPARRRVRTGLGAAGPRPLRAREAEEFLAGELDWDRPLPAELAQRFGQLVADAGEPIDDVRGTADYRRHALGVLARRTLTWVWDEHRGGRSECA